MRKDQNCVGLLTRGAAFMTGYGAVAKPVVTDDALVCFRSEAFQAAIGKLKTKHMRTKHRRPRQNGKGERPHRTLQEGCANRRENISGAESAKAFEGLARLLRPPTPRQRPRWPGTHHQTQPTWWPSTTMPHDTPGETSQVETSDRGCVGVSTPAERQIGRDRTFCACTQCRTVLLKLGLLGADDGADTVSGT